jgi:hypothetical protein
MQAGTQQIRTGARRARFGVPMRVWGGVPSWQERERA